MNHTKEGFNHSNTSYLQDMHEIPQKTPFKITQTTLKTLCCQGFEGERETNENKGSNG